MKGITAILALIVLFLSTKCMVIEYGSPVKCKKTEKSSCSKNKSCGKPEEENSTKNCKTVCNPFMACSGCVYVSTVKEVLTVPSFLFKSVKNGCQTNRFISTYISSAWKPPEFI